MKLRVLVACEYSGVVRDAFVAQGHHAVSCDLLETEAPGVHYQGDVADLLDGWEPVQYNADCGDDDLCNTTKIMMSDCGCIGPTQDGVEYKEVNGVLLGRPVNHPHYDLMIAHPPCTYLSVSGMHWTKRGLRDPQLTEDALDFVRLLMDAPIEKIAIENPVSIISSRIRKPDQCVQPWEYGHDASKKTCLWLKNLPLLIPTKMVPPRIVDGKKRWSNQTDSGQNRLAPNENRWKDRSRTYTGIAEAMAIQWGDSNWMNTHPSLSEYAKLVKRSIRYSSTLDLAARNILAHLKEQGVDTYTLSAIKSSIQKQYREQSL